MFCRVYCNSNELPCDITQSVDDDLFHWKWRLTLCKSALSVGAVEYADCISASYWGVRLPHQQVSRGWQKTSSDWWGSSLGALVNVELYCYYSKPNTDSEW